MTGALRANSQPNRRAGRAQAAGRKIVTACSRAAVRLLFGAGVTDVNVPYRLLRAEALRAMLPQIPPDTFAPNVLISGALALRHARILDIPVPHMSVRSVSVSLKNWRLWAVALLCLRQTISFRLKFK